MKLIKVVVEEEYALFRSGIENLFRNHAWIKLAESTTNFKETVEFLETNSVNLLIKDLGNEKEKSIEDIKKIRLKYPDLKLLIVSLAPTESAVRRCMNLGCHGFITKSAEKMEVIEAINEIIEGNIYVSRKVNTQLIMRLDANPFDEPTQVLTGRELQVLEMVCNEMNSREISESLRISEYTVANHRKSITKKLGAKNLAGLVRYALMNGVL